MIKVTPPAPESLNDYYKSYLKYLKDDDLLKALIEEGRITQEWLLTIPESSETLVYAPGKWMLKEVIGHLIDTERILSCRALRFARNDKTPLPGFDENTFMLESNFKNRSLKDISAEWKSVRSATLSLFSSMNDEFLDRKGLANGVEISPRIILYFILVHERHHKKTIMDRYLSTAFSA